MKIPCLNLVKVLDQTLKNIPFGDFKSANQDNLLKLTVYHQHHHHHHQYCSLIRDCHGDLGDLETVLSIPPDPWLFVASCLV